jgi:kynurenine formamidase
MTIFDLSHTLDDDTPVYPGKSKATFKDIATIAVNGYREKQFSFDSHIGTHIDSPAHMVQNGRSLDRFPVSKFYGTAYIVTIPSHLKIIGREFLDDFMEYIIRSDFLLFRTGWCRKWGTEAYLYNYPFLKSETAEWLTNFKLKGIGIDAISVDPMESSDWPVHNILFRSGLIIIENLNYPDDLSLTGGDFACFPLKIAGADGSPVRAILRVD